MSDINFVNVDSKQIEEGLINLFETAIGEKLYPGDERRIFLLQFTQVLVSLYNSINDTGRQNLLQYARGETLDEIGQRVDTERLPPEKAGCIIQFSASAGHPQITVPAGTRVSPDGKLFFQTTGVLVIPEGQNTGVTTVESTLTGSIYNGFTPGQINILVDTVPYISSVSNTTESAGGAETESDESYRERIREAPSRFSTAGPADAYIYWAKTVDQDIQDVAVTSPAAGQVKVTVLMKDGQAPSQDILDAVLAACNDRKRRPLTDNVSSSAPSFIPFTVNISYTISGERKDEVASIRAAIENDGGAVDQYIAWQIEKLGRKINPDKLRNYLLAAGADTVTITTPAAATVDEDEAAELSGVPSITYSGLS